MSKLLGNPVVEPDGTVHVTKTEVRRKEDPEGEPWMAVSKCGVEFKLDGRVESHITHDMLLVIMVNTDVTCEACRAAP